MSGKIARQNKGRICKIPVGVTVWISGGISSEILEEVPKKDFQREKNLEKFLKNREAIFEKIVEKSLETRKN